MPEVLDKANARIITVALVLIAVVSLAGVILLTLTDNPIPDVLANIASAAFGGIATLATVRASGSAGVTELEAIAEPIKSLPLSYGYGIGGADDPNRPTPGKRRDT